MMKKFKVKRKHLIGDIADFPKRVVQAMVDEQVRQGNPANPSVFAREGFAGKNEGGFNWMNAAPGYSWADIIQGKKFHEIIFSQASCPRRLSCQANPPWLLLATRNLANTLGFAGLPWRTCSSTIACTTRFGKSEIWPVRCFFFTLNFSIIVCTPVLTSGRIL